MADYQESQVNGTKWRRCFQLAVRNTLSTDPENPSIPSIQFYEEDVMLADGKATRLLEASCSVSYDPSAVVNVYDQSTLQPTGETFTHADLYKMLFSAYLETALARDQEVDPA